MKKIILLIVLVFISFMIFNLSKDDDAVLDFNINEEIRKEGVYFSKKFNIIVEIKIVHGFVKFKIFNKKKHKLFDSSNYERKISAYQNWYFLIDQTGVIWIDSSDIGLFYIRCKQGKYRIYSFGIIDRSNINQLPAKIKLLQ